MIPGTDWEHAWDFRGGCPLSPGDLPVGLQDAVGWPACRNVAKARGHFPG
jgi:hypothetical protein